MTNRDEILSRLPRTNPKIGVVGSHLRAFPDLPALFTERLRAAKGEVHRVQDINQGFDRLREIFEHLWWKFFQISAGSLRGSRKISAVGVLRRMPV
ncbi:MAG: hypothetical protein P8Y68_09080 [Anaerolineales bacterium]